MHITPKTLFLTDAAGTLITAVLLSQVLARFEPVFGMPVDILMGLAVIALCYSVFSLSCYIWVRSSENRYLKIIAAANVLYCILTFTLMILLFSVLTWIGIVYFTMEIAIILMLAGLEYRTSKKTAHLS